MTDKQKEAIKALRREGFSYGKVSEKTGIKYEAVKSFCRRNGLIGRGIKQVEDINGRYEFCLNCGTALIQQRHKKRRVFCCDDCRVRWWAEHPEMIKKKAIYSFMEFYFVLLERIERVFILFFELCLCYSFIRKFLQTL